MHLFRGASLRDLFLPRARQSALERHRAAHQPRAGKAGLSEQGPHSIDPGRVLGSICRTDRRGDGLTIIRAGSAADARKIAEQDPFVINKLRSFELREWTVMEGSLSIKVNFSDQSLELA